MCLVLLYEIYDEINYICIFSIELKLFCNESLCGGLLLKRD